LEAHEGKQSLFVLMGDQSPSNMKTTHWLPFLGRDTAWLHGVGTLAVAHNMPIFYFETQRIKRGYYQSTVHELCLNPSAYSPEQISKLYAGFVAQIILKNPSPWLWSHKRWKHRRGNSGTQNF
jgi:KDO2-lipid IV(A) lauroyltransferase